MVPHTLQNFQVWAKQFPDVLEKQWCDWQPTPYVLGLQTPNQLLELHLLLDLQHYRVITHPNPNLAILNIGIENS